MTHSSSCGTEENPRLYVASCKTLPCEIVQLDRLSTPSSDIAHYEGQQVCARSSSTDVAMMSSPVPSLWFTGKGVLETPDVRVRLFIRPNEENISWRGLSPEELPIL